MNADVWTAILAGFAAVLSGYAAVISARRRGEAHCEERLALVRIEAEEVAEELHRLRMER